MSSDHSYSRLLTCNSEPTLRKQKWQSTTAAGAVVANIRKIYHLILVPPPGAFPPA